MSFDFHEAVIATRKGDRRALVATPREHHVVGHERLLSLRAAGDQSPVDQFIIDATCAREDVRVVVFRGGNDDGTGSWGLDSDLSPAEQSELARLLTLSHLPTWRALVANGVWAMVHIDMAQGAVFRDQARSLAEELSDRGPTPSAGAAASGSDLRLSGGTDTEIRRIDEWLIKNWVFYFSQPLKKTLEGVLPDKLPLIETRWPKLETFGEIIRSRAP